MSFYTRMSALVTRLLTEYGAAVTIERRSSTYNAVTGTDSSITLTETETIGVKQKITSEVVGGTRVETGDVLYIIDASYEPQMGDKILIAGTVLPAVYPLDATSGEVGSVGFSAMTLSEVNQKGVFALTGAPVALTKSLACPVNAIYATPDLIDFATGIKAFEFAPTIPASAGGGAASEAYSLRMYLMQSLAAQKVTVILSRYANGTNSVSVALDGSSVYSGTPASFPARIGIAVNGGAGTALIYFDDVLLTLSSDAITGGQWFAAIATFEQTACPAGDAAKLVGGTLYTLNTDLTGTTYPSGTTDIGGNVI